MHGIRTLAVRLPDDPPSWQGLAQGLALVWDHLGHSAMRPGSRSNACLWSAANVMKPPLTSVHICTGWQSQGSAWKRYVAQAADAVGSPKTPPLLFAAPTHAPAEQAQPKVAITPEPPCGQPGGQAAREPAMPAPLQSAPATPALPLPVQLSLERLQEQRRS